MQKPVIRFINLIKSFDSHIIFNDFNWEVHPDETVAIIGPSGSGKSTLLRILMTLEKIDSGFVEIDGENLWHCKTNGKIVAANERHLQTMRRKIGMVFQHFNLFPHMNVLRNVTEAPLHVLGLSPEEAVMRAKELLNMVGLEEKINAYPSQLSGGQKQRVAIARALAMQPKILLLDEITSALDPELVGEVLAVIRDLAKKHQFTILIATHEMNFAREIADRVCFLDKGEIVEEGEPEVIFQHPREKRTQDFLQTYIKR